jgi:hypothetical protein
MMTIQTMILKPGLMKKAMLISTTVLALKAEVVGEIVERDMVHTMIGDTMYQPIHGLFTRVSANMDCIPLAFQADPPNLVV